MKKSKVKWIGYLLTIYHFFARKLEKHKALDPSLEFERIVIYSTTALGDLMFNTPAIHALKLRYPGASFALVSSEKNRPLVEGSEWFNQVFYWDNKVRNCHALIRSLRRFRPQLTVILHSYMPYDILCAVLSGSRYIIRDNYLVDSSELNSWINAYSAPFDGHLIQRKLNLLSILGCEKNDPSMRIPVHFNRAPQDLSKRIGFQMGASESMRCWPVARFVELANRLTASGYRIVLIGGAKDMPLAGQFMELASESVAAQTEILIGKTSLTELLTVIDGLDVLVTGDTGPLHLAVALKTSTVSLYASAEPEHTGPYQDRERHITLRVDDIPGEIRQPLQLIEADDVCIHVTTLAKK